MTSGSVSLRRPWQPCCSDEWTTIQVKRRYQIDLGKMLQPQPSTNLDREVPYLKSLHVQWDGVRLEELPTMWAHEDEIDALRVAVGDLLVCEGGEVGRSAIVREEPPMGCIIQNALHRVRGRTGGDLRFLSYLLRHASYQDWFDVLCNRATIAHFTVDKFGDMWIAVPDENQQRTLADYLDRETSQIDDLLVAKERLLVKIEEKRRAIITGAVIRGLDPNVPLRDSTVPWLGLLPEHWDVERTKWLFTERKERSESGEEELLTVSHLTGVTRRSEKDVNMFEAESTEGYKVCHTGDLVINTLWAWMGAMGVSPMTGIVSPAYHVYIPGQRLYPGYVDALVRIPVFAEEATRLSKGVWSSRLRLYPENFFEIHLPVPPLEEQRVIVAHIQEETAKLDALRSVTEHSITLLRERRSALIASAVTGHLVM